MLNKVILQGRLTANPELRTTQTGLSVTSFSIAVERNFAPAGEKREADFINIVAWRSTAEFIQRYLSKGSMAIFEGYIQTRKYEDKNGDKKTAFEVVAENVYFCENKKEEEKPQKAYTFTDININPSDDNAEELPF